MQVHPEQLRTQVIAEWMAGASLGGLAKAHKLPKSTVQEWVKGQSRIAVVPKENGVEPSRVMDSMAWELVCDGFAASAAILRKAQDSSWLDKQNANDLAIFFGVLSDKQLRLLAAFRRPDEDTRSNPLDVHGAAVVS